MTQQDNNRAAFETWLGFTPDPHASYRYPQVEKMWEAWTAAIQLDRQGRGEPVAWLRNLTDPQPHAVTSPKYRTAADAAAGVEYVPVYAAPQPAEPVKEVSDEDAYVIEQMGKLLAEIAIIVRGPEPPLHRHGYHDLPERVAALQAACVAAQPSVPGKFRAEAIKLADILTGMVECGDPDPNMLYTKDQPDGDPFVSRAATLLRLIAAAPTPPADDHGVCPTAEHKIDTPPAVDKPRERGRDLTAAERWAKDAPMGETALTTPSDGQAQPDADKVDAQQYGVVVCDRRVPNAMQTFIPRRLYQDSWWSDDRFSKVPVYAAPDPACIAPASDKTACGAQNVESEQQAHEIDPGPTCVYCSVVIDGEQPNPAMAGDDDLLIKQLSERNTSLDNRCAELERENDALRVQPSSGEDAQPAQAISDELLHFLHGSGAIDGIWFGEKHPAYVGAFWWRILLPQPGAQQGDQS